MKHFLLGVGMCLLTMVSQAQNTSPENVRLAAVCRAWGFLKYYHPATQSPSGFWDQQLMNAVRDSFAVRSDADASYVITKWISMLNSKQPLGKPLPERIWSQREARNFNPPWYEKSEIFRDPLNANLQNVWRCKRKNELYHVAYGDDLVPSFPSEVNYADWKYPNEAGRILTVARLWNALNYFYPFASQSIYPMNQLLEQGISEVRAAGNITAYHEALWHMLGSLNNPNVFMDSEMLDEKFGIMYVPLKTFYENGKLYVTGFYAAEELDGTDVQLGDAISEIDGMPVDSILLKRFSNWYKLSPCDQFRLGSLALMGKNPAAGLKIARAEQEVSNKVIRRVQKLIPSKGTTNVAWSRLDAQTGLVNMEEVGTANLKQVMDSVFAVQKVLLDLRNDPGIEPELLAKYFCKDKVNYQVISRAEMANPGYFIDGEVGVWGKASKTAYTGTVMVLVNENSSERGMRLASMMAYLPNATVVGSCAAGMDPNKMTISLPGGITVLVSGIGHYGAGMESKLHGAVQVDRQAIPSAADLSSGKDVVKAKAMEP